MTRRRALGGILAAALAGLFLGDFAGPGPSSAPLPSPLPPAPLAAILPKLPARNVGRFDKPGDPMNLLLIGTEEQVRSALLEAGWTSIPVRIPASFRSGLGELLRGRMFRSFPPMNLYRLGGRVQDQNWSMPITAIARRHHFRLWRSPFRDEAGREVWWGSGNLDLKVRWRDLSHTPDPDADRERDFIGSTLEGSPWVASKTLMAAPQIPREGANDKGYPFHNDGRVLVVALKPAR